jgi:isopenicillin N synthase-like dioxygenase
LNKYRESGTRNDESTATIPAIDLADFLTGTKGERRRIADQVDEIFRSIGFLIVRQHGVPSETCDTAWSSARAFFDLPLEKKLIAKSANAGCPRGYFSIREESLARTRGVATPPDVKESFSSGPLSAPAGHTRNDEFDFFYGPNIWPAEPETFRKHWTNYYLAMERLGSQIMQLIASALHLDDHYFVEFHTHHLSALRALNYPSTSDPLLPEQQRAGAHSDYGSVTILNPDPFVGGLEVQLPSGEWVSAPIISDAFIVNVGDLLARWTNDRWISTLHRVSNTTGRMDDTMPRRQSIAYFMNPNYDTTISAIRTCLGKHESPKYSPVLAGEYLIRKFSAAI